MKLVFATGNIGKLREASEILGEGFELVSLEQVGITEDIPETGKTLVANSLQKAMYLYDKLGRVGEFIDEVIIHGILDTLKLVLFLFLTYLLMEFIEHKASDKARAIMQKAGHLGPVVGGLFGAVPQCGFSAAAANLYTGRVISLGTLVAVFLSTSDEMLPMMISLG